MQKPAKKEDDYSVQELENAIKRCDDNIEIFMGEVEKQKQLKMEFQLLLMKVEQQFS